MDNADEAREEPHEEMGTPVREHHAEANRHVRLGLSIEEPKSAPGQASANSASREKDSPGAAEEENDDGSTVRKTLFDGFVSYLALRTEWIPSHITTTHMKPVFRSAVCAWVSVILLVIPRVEAVMGQVSPVRSSYHIPELHVSLRPVS